LKNGNNIYTYDIPIKNTQGISRTGLLYIALGFSGISNTNYFAKNVRFKAIKNSLPKLFNYFSSEIQYANKAGQADEAIKSLISESAGIKDILSNSKILDSFGGSG